MVKEVDNPYKDIKEVIKNGRKFAVGKYKAISPRTKKLTNYTAWRVLGMAKKKK